MKWILVAAALTLSLPGCLSVPADEGDHRESDGDSNGYSVPSETMAFGPEILEQPALSVDPKNRSIPTWMSVTVRNVDQDTWFMTFRDDFRIRDSEGFVYGHLDQGYYYAPEPFPTSVRLGAGEAVRGTLVFDVGDGAAPYTLVYNWPEGTIEVAL